MRRNWRRRKLSLVSGKLIPLHQLFLNLRLLDEDWIAEWSRLELPTWKIKEPDEGIGKLELSEKTCSSVGSVFVTISSKRWHKYSYDEFLPNRRHWTAAAKCGGRIKDILELSSHAIFSCVGKCCISHSVTDAGGIYVHLPSFQRLRLQEKIFSTDSSNRSTYTWKEGHRHPRIGIIQLD